MFGTTVSGSHAWLVLGRYKANGSVDTTYGVNGFVTTPVNDFSGRVAARAMAIQPDGKIVALG